MGLIQGNCIYSHQPKLIIRFKLSVTTDCINDKVKFELGPYLILTTEFCYRSRKGRSQARERDVGIFWFLIVNFMNLFSHCTQWLQCKFSDSVLVSRYRGLRLIRIPAIMLKRNCAKGGTRNREYCSPVFLLGIKGAYGPGWFLNWPILLSLLKTEIDLPICKIYSPLC